MRVFIQLQSLWRHVEGGTNIKFLCYLIGFGSKSEITDFPAASSIENVGGF